MQHDDSYLVLHCNQHRVPNRKAAAESWCPLLVPGLAAEQSSVLPCEAAAEGMLAEPGWMLTKHSYGAQGSIWATATNANEIMTMRMICACFAFGIFLL